jgi:hypothetical protein
MNYYSSQPYLITLHQVIAKEDLSHTFLNLNSIMMSNSDHKNDLYGNHLSIICYMFTQRITVLDSYKLVVEKFLTYC